MFGLSLVILAAAPLAMPGLQMIDVPPARGGFYTEQLAAELIKDGVKVITEREISALLGLERQRQLLGCSGESSCLVELANALGSEAVLLGQVAKVGKGFQASIRVVNAGNGSTLAISTFKAADEEALLDALAQTAKDLADQLGAGSKPAASTGTGFSIPRRIWWEPAIAAGALLAAGGACLGASRSDYGQLDPSPGPRIAIADAQSIASRGRTLQTAAVVLLITGGAAALVTVAIGGFGADAKVAAAVGPDGAAVSLGGTF